MKDGAAGPWESPHRRWPQQMASMRLRSRPPSHRFRSASGVAPGKVYQPIRVAITGSSVSPGIFESLAALGRDESLARIDAALERLSREAA